jgi:hypothetical protein
MIMEAANEGICACRRVNFVIKIQSFFFNIMSDEQLDIISNVPFEMALHLLEEYQKTHGTQSLIKDIRPINKYHATVVDWILRSGINRKYNLPLVINIHLNMPSLHEGDNGTISRIEREIAGMRLNQEEQEGQEGQEGQEEDWDRDRILLLIESYFNVQRGLEDSLLRRLSGQIKAIISREYENITGVATEGDFKVILNTVFAICLADYLLDEANGRRSLEIINGNGNGNGNGRLTRWHDLISAPGYFSVAKGLANDPSSMTIFKRVPKSLEDLTHDIYQYMANSSLVILRSDGLLVSKIHVI